MSISRQSSYWRAALVSALAIAAPMASAQQVRSPFEDATVLPRGVIRGSVAPAFGRWHERFADGFGRARRGKRESLAADFDLDSVGPSVFPALANVGTSLQSILGAAPSGVTLGRLQTRFDMEGTITPIALDIGVSKRVMIGGVLPLVRMRNEVSVIPNPAGTEANVGLNPAIANIGARSINAQVVTQLTSAATALQSLITSCAGSSAPSCTAINGNLATATALITSANGVATGIAGLYGTSTTTPGQLFAPVERGTLHNAVYARLDAMAAAFAALLGAPTQGGTSWIGARPVGAAPIGYRDLQSILRDQAYGIQADSLLSVEHDLMGDMEVNAKVLLFDGFGDEQPNKASGRGVRVRAAVGGAFRMPTATFPLPDKFTDPGTGDAQSDIEGRAYTDIAVGKHFWVSIVGKYAVQLADERTLRVPKAPHDPFPEANRKATVTRDLGDLMSLEIAPRYVFGQSLAVSAAYSYLHKGEDAYSFSSASTGTLDLSPLEAGTERTLQRAFLGITYSTVASHAAKRAKLPVEVSYVIGRSFAGAGNAPRISSTTLMLRYYKQLF